MAVTVFPCSLFRWYKSCHVNVRTILKYRSQVASSRQQNNELIGVDDGTNLLLYACKSSRASSLEIRNAFSLPSCFCNLTYDTNDISCPIQNMTILQRSIYKTRQSPATRIEQRVCQLTRVYFCKFFLTRRIY